MIVATYFMHTTEGRLQIYHYPTAGTEFNLDITNKQIESSDQIIFMIRNKLRCVKKVVTFKLTGALSFWHNIYKAKQLW